MTTAAQTLLYNVDPVHSAAHFSVRHLMISKVRGTFKKLTGAISLPQSGLIPASVQITIESASIDTGEPQRDDHLRSADFFDAEHFPKLEFTSSSIRPIDETKFEVTGELEIHGVRKPFTVTAELEGQGNDPWGGERVAYSTAFKIDREDFGLTWNQALEAGGIAVGKEISITLDVEAVLAKA